LVSGPLLSNSDASCSHEANLVQETDVVFVFATVL
jgi:hypothetical protein